VIVDEEPVGPEPPALIRDLAVSLGATAVVCVLFVLVTASHTPPHARVPVATPTAVPVAPAAPARPGIPGQISVRPGDCVSVLVLTATGSPGPTPSPVRAVAPLAVCAPGGTILLGDPRPATTAP
jgi:hypothetical protein